MRSMQVDEFLRRLQDQVSSGQNPTQFALFVGAGCSVSSGIPASQALVRDRWLPQLQRLKAPQTRDLDNWCRQEYGIDQEIMPSGSYSRILLDLFPYAIDRQREIEQICSAAKPGFGYATLAQLIAQTAGSMNVVLTTNFDDLLADALYLFTGLRPLVIQHGSLSPYIQASQDRPLIVKLHGHHQFSPQNTAEETQAIEDDICKGVAALLHGRGLIFIGYGGRDEGVRKMLSSLSTNLPRFGVYWIARSKPENELSQWLEERQAFWIENPDFDQLMVRVRDTFQIDMPSK